MAKVNAQIKTLSTADKSSTTTITNINPSVEDSVILQMAQRLSSLSSDSYVSTNKIITTNLDDEGDNRQIPNLSVANQTMTIQNSSVSNQITYDGDGRLYTYTSEGCNGITAGIGVNKDNNNKYLLVAPDGNSVYVKSSGKVVLRAEETSTYKPAEVEITITKS